MDVEDATVTGHELHGADRVFELFEICAARPTAFGRAPQGTQYSIRTAAAASTSRVYVWVASGRCCPCASSTEVRRGGPWASGLSAEGGSGHLGVGACG